MANMRIVQILLLLALSLPGYGQASTAANNSRYPDFRRPSYPDYGLEQVQTFIQKNKYQRESGMNKPVSEDAYQSLDLREQFTYAMIYPERYLQNCSGSEYFFRRGALFARLNSGYNENTLSRRQIHFLKKNRDSVMALIRATTDQQKTWGINFKQAIIEINGWEAIPALMAYYRQRPDDTDVLTTFMALMANDVFSRFVQSPYYEQLYGAQSRYNATIDLDKTTETFILNTTMDYYQSRTGKRLSKRASK